MRSRALVPLILALCLLLPLASPGVSAQGSHFDVSGRVVDDMGEPVLDARVSVVNVTSDEEYSVGVDGVGNFSVSIPAGVYNITVQAQGYEANDSYVDLMVNENLTAIDFQLLPLLGGLTGFVTNGTVPVAGARIYLTNQGHNYTTSSSLPFGQYTIDDVEPGVYVAFAEKEGYRLSINATPIAISKGVMAVANFSLDEQPARLYGKVLSDGEAVEGALVTIGEGDDRVQTTTDSGGNYSFEDLVAGTYPVSVEKEGYVDSSITVTVKPFEERRMDLSMDQEEEGQETYIAGFDLPHSLMVAGLILALSVLVIAIVIRFRVHRNPDMLESEEE